MFTWSLPAHADADHSAVQYPKVLRYDEDYRYLLDPARHSDMWDPIKFIPLVSSGNVYLSFGGEWRERFEHYNGSIAGSGSDDVLLNRAMLSADLHVGDSFRTFVQLSTLSQNGRNGGSLSTDENNLDFQQAFADISSSVDMDGRVVLRAGRQEMIYGSGRFVSMREGPNARRSFDGVRAMYRSQDFDLDGFIVEPVTLRPGVFDDKSDTTRSFWGSYGVARLSPNTNADLYYFGFDYDKSIYTAGSGSENRHTVGTRAWGKDGTFDYNVELVYQFGTFASLDIRAWGASADIGWSLTSLPFSPRVGIKTNIESGDRNSKDGVLGTFNPLFPNHAYFSEAAVGAPMNDMDVQPNVTFHLADGVSLLVGYDFFWRQSEQDAVYSATLIPFKGTAGVEGRYVGNLVTSHLKWQIDRHVELNFDYTHFAASDMIKSAGGTDVDFAMVSAAYKF